MFLDFVINELDDDLVCSCGTTSRSGGSRVSSLLLYHVCESDQQEQEQNANQVNEQLMNNNNSYC